MAVVVFRDPYKYKLRKELFIAVEGMYTGQFVYCGRKANLQVGNILPIGTMPEGTVICNLEEKAGDRGKLARASGNYATVISHNPDTKVNSHYSDIYIHILILYLKIVENSCQTTFWRKEGNPICKPSHGWNCCWRWTY